ncbi:hypothetical protein E5C26_11550 [Serratia proteamaculans]|uniref:fimbria/pilus chaperone family protein n=1 Tax=Serratia proteamaculans TaxID=28151 RepID=UPI0010764214|nr:fimbria/pilus chaperone family protein [Serratia proteamaculans]TFZ50995.1 hypothetical protein E5C26_11550 [Serratia proteamaculans]
MKYHPVANGLMLVGLLSLGPVCIAGLRPEVSVLIVNADDGEATINIKNVDPAPVMLLTKIGHIDEDKANLLTIMPPLARVEANATKQVRFVLTGDRDFRVQRLQRVYFAGLPIRAVVGNTFEEGERQSLPVIINPKGLAKKRDPWTLLQWRVINHQLVVNNLSPYVVCLAQAVVVLPDKQKLLLPRDYVLPGEQLSLQASHQAALADLSKITFYPADIYGDVVGSYTADVGK